MDHVCAIFSRWMPAWKKNDERWKKCFLSAANNLTFDLHLTAARVTLFSLYQNIIPENLGFHKFITTKMNFPILIKKYLRDLSDVPK